MAQAVISSPDCGTCTSIPWPTSRSTPRSRTWPLQTATLNPARVLGLETGTIEPGKLADLVLLDANPLADIGNTRRIRAVVADGRLYRRADLDRLLEQSRR
jgi:cytosine/adenosine deaminase-related metal-dependent hydrolase